MQEVVDIAREGTGADSSNIVLLNKTTDDFVIVARSPDISIAARDFPRSQGGLTRHITETGEAIKIDNSTIDKRVRDKVIEEGIRSFIGVYLQIGEEREDVLYVNGKNENNFTDDDLQLLNGLAERVSLALGGARLFLKPLDQIEKSTSGLYIIEETLKNISEDIKDRMCSDYVAVQLVNPEEIMIETVYGTDIAGNWVGRAKHRLDSTPKFRDIQADLVLARPPRVEIISGWDNRFDEWIYKEYNHKELTRVFIPIIVIRNDKWETLDNWSKYVDFEESDEKERSDTTEGRYASIKIHIPEYLPDNTITMLDIIGTIEVGYIDPEKIIETQEIIELIHYISKKTINIRQTQLTYVLEVVAEHARKILDAGSASLHFLNKSSSGKYVYEVSVGEINKKFLDKYPPRSEGLGKYAIETGEAKFIPDPSQGHDEDELKKTNFPIWQQGIRSKIAFPLILDKDQYGVLYIHFRYIHRFTEDEINTVQHFANKAVNAIRYAKTYQQMQERTLQLKALNELGKSLIKLDENQDLLYYSAWSILNILAADVVTIYAYNADTKEFLIPPSIAGRLHDPENMNNKIFDNDVPALIVNRNEHKSYSPIYSHDSVRNELLNNLNRNRPTKRRTSFVIRENIKSSVGLPLKVGEEIVGVMFINFRHTHKFTGEEKDLIDTMVSTIAFAIKSLRWHETIKQRGIKERERAWRDFSADVAHKMRHDASDIGGAILGLQEALGNKSQTKDMLEKFNRTDIALARLCTSIDKFTEFYKQQEFKYHPVNINSILEDTINNSTVKGLEKISIDLKLDNNIPYILGDHAKLFDAFSEILDNSVKSMEYGGSIVVQTLFLKGLGEKPNSIEIVFADTGNGIDPSIKKNIFEAGFTQREGGIGLGLSIVKTTIEKHSGIIREVGDHDAGACFIINLPTRVEGIEESIEDNIHILLVDDSDNQRGDMAGQIIKKYPYVDLIEARSEEEAQQLIATNNFDVVITDINFANTTGNKFGGIEILKQVRSSDPKIPVIVVTAYGETSIKIQDDERTYRLSTQVYVRQLGAFDCIRRDAKSYLVTLVEKLREALELRDSCILRIDTP
jgi:signal transduction histidine kinase/CheY-like chemotaxis protein